MTRKIFRSIFFTSLSVLIASLVFVMGILYEVFESRIKSELANEADYISYTVSSGDKALLNKLPETDNRITLIAENGDIIADTKADVTKMENHSDREEFKKAKQYGSGFSTRYSSTLTEKTIYYAKKLDDESIVRISTTQYTILTLFLGLMQPIIFIIFAALILSLFLSSKLSKSIIKPINEIDLDNPEDFTAYDELSPFLHKIIGQNRTIKKQIKKAKQMQEEFRLITENMNEGFLVIDRRANLLSCNFAALKLLGAKKVEGNVLTLNRTSSFREAIKDALSGKRAENIMQHEDKTYNLIANPVTEKNTVTGAVIVILDVTESAKRETMRREFTANVSHELKTPLTSISGFAEIMKNGGLPEETVIDFSNSIYSEAQRLIALVRDIIKISELEENTENFEEEKTDLYELSAEVIKRLTPNAKKKNITLELCGEHAVIMGVKQILDEMIYNLCDNAIKYNKNGGKVLTEISKTDENIYLSVSDTGIGIPSSQKERIFERFYRVDKSRSKAEGGTGLGLSIVKHGAVYHHAKISLDSTVGKGTKITVIFPVSR